MYGSGAKNIRFFKDRADKSEKKSICFWLFDFRGQFHLHFTFSFYVPRSQKPQKDGQLKQLFALLGSAGVKAVHKHVDEIDPWFLHTGLGKNVEWSNVDLEK